MQIFFSLFSLTSVVEIIASISYSLFFSPVIFFQAIRGYVYVLQKLIFSL